MIPRTLHAAPMMVAAASLLSVVATTITAGGVLCHDCRVPGSAVPSPETLVLLGALLSGDWRTADACAPRYWREGSGLVAAYLQWHLERGIRSMRYVEK